MALPTTGEGDGETEAALPAGSSPRPGSGWDGSADHQRQQRSAPTWRCCDELQTPSHLAFMGWGHSDKIRLKPKHIQLQVYMQPSSSINWICEAMSVGALGLHLACQISLSSIIPQEQYPISIWTLMQLVIEMCCNSAISEWYLPKSLNVRLAKLNAGFECQFLQFMLKAMNGGIMHWISSPAANAGCCAKILARCQCYVGEFIALCGGDWFILCELIAIWTNVCSLTQQQSLISWARWGSLKQPSTTNTTQWGPGPCPDMTHPMCLGFRSSSSIFASLCFKPMFISLQCLLLSSTFCCSRQISHQASIQ